ncbi:bifunctional RNase H/acid phosphatase [Corynebacterium mendelii]|nr:bifunctional RNase H/acid phosphatase [Corynebacterium mendelii]
MKVIIEADGGSRGNPGTAGCGTVVYDGEHTTVLARIAEYLGRHTNNVAEYHGLINGLSAARALGAGEVAVFLDSKLVVEQMTGRWKIKHADMRALAAEAKKIAENFDHVSYQWIERAKNSAADALANKAMDAARDLGHRPAILVLDEEDAGPEFDTVYRALVGSAGKTQSSPGRSRTKTSDSPAPSKPEPDDELIGLFDIPGRAGTSRADSPAPAAGRTKTTATAACPAPGATGDNSGTTGEADTSPTRLVVLRHGETEMSIARCYSGGSSDPELTETGRRQARCAAGWLLSLAGSDHPAGTIDAIVTSPLVRCTATAQLIGRVLDCPVTTVDGLTELDFGDWDGHTFAQAHRMNPQLHRKFLTDTSVCCPNGESVDQAHRRVTEAIDQLLDTHRGRTVLVVTHVSPIKSIVRRVLGAGPEANTAIHLDLSSVSIVEFYADGPTSLRLLNSTEHLH